MWGQATEFVVRLEMVNVGESPELTDCVEKLEGCRAAGAD
jgi:hypothetical protein